jgi:antitoxin component HigA of HigAB toxin-antitoxin module
LSNPLTDPKGTPVSPISLKSYQPDLFGGQVVDLGSYRRGRLPSDIAASVRAEMRARGVTQDELAIELGISQPQLANALAGRFGLSREAAARLLAWLRRAA